MNTSATEYCDSIDNDCDGETDEDDADDASTFYADDDGDGYGDPDITTEACSAPTGYVSDDEDCDDDDEDINPGATEVCDDIDNDCDEDIDDDDSSISDQTTWYLDDDEDGFGDPSSTTVDSCDQPSGYVDNDDDCDDSTNTIEDSITWYADDDSDGYGDPDDSTDSCTEPSGYVDNDEDCDDADGAINPDEDELCSTIYDDDCDGTENEDDAVDAPTWYDDNDGDGYGDSSTGATACTQPSGTSSDDTDCDDDDGDTYPGASEVCYDGVVNDCNGSASTALAQCTLTGTVSLTTAVTLYGRANNDEFGTRLYAPGDLDGDGHDDLLSTAPRNDDYATDSGAVYLSYGPLSDGEITVEASIEGDSNNVRLGNSLDVMDYDGDGDPDFLIGASKKNNGTGAAFLVLGPMSGTMNTSNALLTLTGETTDDGAGWTVAAIADHDSDGNPDIAVGAPGDDDNANASGATYLVYGFSSGSSSLVNAQKLLGEGADDNAGSSVAGNGDFNGDGTDDLAIGAPGYGTKFGRVYLFHGPVSSGVTSLADAEVIVTGVATGDQLGEGLTMGGDFSGDGTDDLLMGAPYDDNGASDAGVAFVLFGNISSTSISAFYSDAQFAAGGTGDHLGEALAFVEDIDADGSDEILLGASDNKTNGAGSGLVYLSYGGTSGGLIPDATINSDAAGDAVGTSLVYLGDTDKDGVGELAVGAIGVDGSGNNLGAIYVLGVAAY